MRKIEIILGGLILVLMVSRLLIAYPFSSLLITFSCLFLSLLYWFLGIALFNNIKLRNLFKKESFRGISVLRILLSIVTGFALSSLVIYMLFKFQLWPYGDDGLRISLIWLAIIIVAVTIKYLVSKDKFYSNFLIRPLTLGVYGLILFFISSEQLIEIRYKDFPDYVEAEKQLMKDPQNIYLQQKANEERQKMIESDN